MEATGSGRVRETPVEEAVHLINMLTLSGGVWPTMKPPSDAALAILQETVREAPLKVYRGMRISLPQTETLTGPEKWIGTPREIYKAVRKLQPGDIAPSWLRKEGNDYASSSKNIQKARAYMKEGSFQILLSATVNRSDILVDLTNWKRVLTKYNAVDPDENWTYYSREKEVIVLEPVTWTVEEVYELPQYRKFTFAEVSRPVSKMDQIDLRALKRTPKGWQRLMAQFPETLVRELMVERPRPDYRDVEEISEWTLASPGPVEVQLRALVQDPDNQRSVSRAPPDVVEDINALWGTDIAVGPQLDLNPGRYRAYAEQRSSSAKPSVLVNGTVLFGVARFVAALLRGDRTLRVWDLRTTNPQSSRNGYATKRKAGKTVKLYRGEPIWLKSDNKKENEARYRALRDAIGKPYPTRAGSMRAVYCSPDYQYVQEYIKGSTYPGKPTPDFGVVSIIETPLSNVEIDEAVMTNLYAFGSDKIEQAGVTGVKQLQAMFVKVFGPAVKKYLKADANFSDQAAVDKLRNKPEVVKQWIDTIQGGGELKSDPKGGQSSADEYLERLGKELKDTVEAIGQDEAVVDYFLRHKPTGDITEWAFKIMDPSKTKLVEVKGIKTAKTAGYSAVRLASPDIEKLFNQVARLQRGAPEEAMMRATKFYDGGVLPHLLEHVGDLIHRMTESVTFDDGGYTAVSEKVPMALHYLQRPYGFAREEAEQRASNARAEGLSVEEFTAKLQPLLDRYVAEHRKLPTYNRAQNLAQRAAIALGTERYDECEAALLQLNRRLGDWKVWAAFAHQYGDSSDDNPELETAKRIGERCLDICGELLEVQVNLEALLAPYPELKEAYRESPSEAVQTFLDQAVPYFQRILDCLDAPTISLAEPKAEESAQSIEDAERLVNSYFYKAQRLLDWFSPSLETLTNMWSIPGADRSTWFAIRADLLEVKIALGRLSRALR